MGTLILPSSVAAERELIDAERREQVYAEHGKQWTHELKGIDPTLEVVRASEHATDPDLIPGRWYILKHIPDGPDAYLELPRPPGGWLYDWLTANDMWNPRVHRSKQEAKERLRSARVRAQKLEDEQRTDGMAEAYRAARRLRDDRGMTHSSAAKRRGDGLKKPSK